jgi:hypothetical protein
MLDQADLIWGRYAGGSIAPIGSYLNLRTLCIFQQTADGALPIDGTFHRVDPSGTQTFASIATTVNAALGTSYTASSFHACGSGDSTLQGQGANDA